MGKQPKAHGEKNCTGVRWSQQSLVWAVEEAKGIVRASCMGEEAEDIREPKPAECGSRPPFGPG